MRTIRQIVFFWGFFLAVMPAAIIWIESKIGLSNYGLSAPGIRLAGVIVLVVASALGLWSGLTMALQGDGTPLPATCANKLVLSGPYCYVRNPMALAGIAQGVGVGLTFGSPLTVLYALSGALVWNWFVRPAEEADLRARFGEAYVRYQRDVRCWIPRPTAYRQVSSQKSAVDG